MRYEVRDSQTLVGLLVDEGIVRPDAIGSTGISYGGGFSTMLAFLRNRVRLPDGSYAPWTSPSGTPISLTAAWPRWMWSNGESIFARNGRGAWSRTPPGAIVQSYAAGIFLTAFSGNVAPTGGDLSTDITLWKQQLDAGIFDTATKSTLDNAYNFHGVAGVTRATGGPSPLLMQSGWTDALFPVGQALSAYDAVRKADPKAPVALQLSDSGHGPGVNHPLDVDALARGSLRLSSKRKLKITDKGASQKLASAVQGLAAPGALCTPQKQDGTSHAKLSTTSRGVTLIGQPVITGKVVTKGTYGQIDARVWDIDPKTRKQRLITRGVYRLVDNQKGSFKFILDGNGWKFAKKHRIVVELLGRDAPTYAASPTPFSATLTKVKVKLPVR
jgi:hypothetical protein